MPESVMNCPDWDDLRYILAVTRNGSAAAAARVLGVTHATVLRRLQSVERDYGVRLFDRTPSGYHTTADGRKLAAIAETIEASINDAQRCFPAAGKICGGRCVSARRTR